MMDIKDPQWAVGRQVLVRGHEREGLRTITQHMNQERYDGGVRLHEPIDGIFRSWNIDALICEDEWKLVEKFNKVREEYEAASKEVEAYFMPLVREALKRPVQEDLTEAKSLLQRCPSESITKVFIMDAIRQEKIRRGQLEEKA